MSDGVQLTQHNEPKPVSVLASVFNSIAALALFSLMLITCVDVFGRYLFNKPLTGSTELTEIGLGIIVFAILPVVTWREEHVVVDLLDPLFSARIAKIRAVLLQIIATVTFAYLGYRVYILAERSASYGEMTEYLHIPISAMIYFIAIMCWITAFFAITYGVKRLISSPPPRHVTPTDV